MLSTVFFYHVAYFAYLVASAITRQLLILPTSTSIMKERSCPYCSKAVNSLSGLSRYQAKCPVLIGKEARVVWNDMQADLVQEAQLGTIPHKYKLDGSDSMIGDESWGYTDELSNNENNRVLLDIEDETMDSNLGTLPRL